MKKFISTVLALAMTVTSLPTVLAQNADADLAIPEIESGYTITYPEPADESLANDATDTSDDNTNSGTDYLKLAYIVHKQDGADTAFEEYYNNTYTMSAEDMLSYYFTTDEIAALSASDTGYDNSILFKLLICFLESSELSDTEKQSIITEINGGAQIYYILRLYLEFTMLDDATKAELNNSFYEFYGFKQNQPQTYSTSEYEQAIEEFAVENKYYTSQGNNLYIDDSTGNVQYQRTDLSIPVKNGLSMDLTVKYDLGDAYFAYYNRNGSNTVYNTPLGNGWLFNVTHANYNIITLADGRSLSVYGTEARNNYCADVDYVYDEETGERYVSYRDGTKEYFNTAPELEFQYIYKKVDKYGNTVFYDYDPSNRKKITRIHNNVSSLDINIEYDDAENKVIATAPDGSKITYEKQSKTYTYGAYEGPDHTATTNELACIYSTASNEAHVTFEYALIDCWEYEGINGETELKAYSGLTYVLESPGFENHIITYTTNYAKANIITVPAIQSYKSKQTAAQPEKTYSYSCNTNTYYTTVTHSDGKWESISRGATQKITQLYEDAVGGDILRQKTVINHPQYRIHIPDSTQTTIYNNNGDSITTKYTYTYNADKQPTKCIMTIDSEEVSTTEYQYYDNAYKSLYGIDVLKGSELFSYTVYTVNNYGDVTEEYSAGGEAAKKTAYTYNSDNNVIKTEVKDVNNNVLSLQTMEYSDTYNNAVLTKSTNGVGNSVTYEYDPDTLRLIKTTDGRNNSHEIEYDSYGRIIKETNPDNTSIDIEYENVDGYISVTNEKGYKLTYDYAYGQVEKLLEGDNLGTPLTTIGFDDRARPISTTDALGNTTTVEYDKLGRQSKVTYPAIGSNAAGSVQVKYYDVFLEGTTKYSMRMTISQENAVSLEYFDTRGRLVKTAMVNNPSTLLAYSGIDTMRSLPSSTQLIVTATYTYDNWDRLIQSADGMGRTTSYTYDVFGNVLSTTYGDGTKLFPVYYEYDAAGRMTKMTQGTHVTTYVYNKADQLTKMTDPMGYTETYTYDAAGNVATSKDKNNIITTYTYDNRNRVLSQVKGTKSISYTYDSIGNVLTQTNENGIIRLEYNTDGTLKKKIMPDTKSISYTYNAAKQVTSMTDYFGAVTSYTYTGGSYISKIDTAHGDIEYYYRKDGKLTDEYAESNEITYMYDALGRVNYIWPGNEGILGYAYDNSGNIITKVDSGAGVTTTYTYDNVNRLITEKPGSQTYSYTYDKYNNMTYAITDVDKGYSYDANNRMTSMNIYGAEENGNMYDFLYSLTYDKNGNMITKDCRVEPWSSSENISIAYGEYTYNVWGELTDAYIEKPASTVTYNTDYTYYADGMRKSKTVNTIDSTTTTNTYQYYYNGDNVLNETKNSANYATNIIGVTGIEGRKQSGTTGFFGKDLHGDVRYAFNSSGTKIADYTYDAWGNEESSSTSTWAQDNPVRYNGQYYDTETGMYYLRARYYDPQMSRFISEDPIEDGVNWYAYAGNNPVMFVDPSGLAIEIVYDYIINNLEIIYESKNIMNETEPYTVEYADAYSKAMEAKKTIAETTSVYNEETLHLDELLRVIVEGNNSSSNDIKHTISVAQEVKEKLLEEKKYSTADLKSDAIEILTLIKMEFTSPMVYNGKDYQQEYYEEMFPSPTPYSGIETYGQIDDTIDLTEAPNIN